MKVLLQIGIVLLFAFLGFVAGGMVGAQFVPAGAGLAGGATVFLWAIGGLVVGTIGGAMAVSRLSMRAQRLAFLVAALLAAVMLVWIVGRAAGQSVFRLPRAATLHAAALVQRHPPIGLESTELNRGGTPMGPRMRIGLVAVVGLLGVGAPAAGQFPALNFGTVTARIDGAPFSAVVSIASMADGDLVLSNISNQVQLQVPNAKLGTFELKLDADGGLVDLELTLRTGPKRFVTPVSGSVTIEVLDAEKASGRFEFNGRDVATEQPVKVTDGRFQVTLIPKP